MRRTCQVLAHNGHDARTTFKGSSSQGIFRRPERLGTNTNKIGLSTRHGPSQSPPSNSETKDGDPAQAKDAAREQLVKKKKTLAEMDEELRLKMEGIAGDGGEAGVELEDGVPVAMKRSVRNNMFRYI
ncbi:hypothetical protein QBC34DRAFT_418953 [Podospora aff. communis PSN243]|uniref:Uncharacterized protein n=1 Tax=Podospora aff. communis PSN243 TaxID=3040156 RepID=A0AAV9G0V4_9PEZI|nr:hypothetical protein QBC34DRAFT_418953 [Podospora aff. communis PSN243]